MPSQLLRVLKAHSRSALVWEPSRLSSWRSAARDLTSLRRTTFTAPRFHSCRARVSALELKQPLWTQLLRVHLQQLFNQGAPCLCLQRLPPIPASPSPTLKNLARLMDPLPLLIPRFQHHLVNVHSTLASTLFCILRPKELADTTMRCSASLPERKISLTRCGHIQSCTAHLHHRMTH